MNHFKDSLIKNLDKLKTKVKSLIFNSNNNNKVLMQANTHGLFFVYFLATNWLLQRITGFKNWPKITYICWWYNYNEVNILS